MGTKNIVVVVVLLSSIYSTASFEGEEDGGKRSHRHKERFCMGQLVKPTQTRIRVDDRCRKEFPESKRCARLCRLEALKVVTSKGVNAKAWASYVEYSYPTAAFSSLVPRMQNCSAEFARGTNSTSSPNCSENANFMFCLKTAVDEVCGPTTSRLETA